MLFDPRPSVLGKMKWDTLILPRLMYSTRNSARSVGELRRARHSETRRQHQTSRPKLCSRVPQLRLEHTLPPRRAKTLPMACVDGRVHSHENATGRQREQHSHGSPVRGPSDPPHAGAGGLAFSRGAVRPARPPWAVIGNLLVERLEAPASVIEGVSQRSQKGDPNPVPGFPVALYTPK